MSKTSRNESSNVSSRLARSDGRGQPLDAATHLCQRTRAGRGRGERGAIDLGHGVDPVNVRAAQAEHARHAGVRGDAGELRLHALEQRAGVFGAQVSGRELVLGPGVRMDHEHGRARVLQHVLPRLAEELVRQRHVPGIDVVHLGDVRHIRRAVSGAGRDDRRHGAFEAGADGMQCDRRRHCASRWPGSRAWRLQECRRERECDCHEVRRFAANRAGELGRVTDQLQVLYPGLQMLLRDAPVSACHAGDPCV